MWDSLTLSVTHDQSLSVIHIFRLQNQPGVAMSIQPEDALCLLNSVTWKRIFHYLKSLDDLIPRQALLQQYDT